MATAPGILILLFSTPIGEKPNCSDPKSGTRKEKRTDRVWHPPPCNVGAAAQSPAIPETAEHCIGDNGITRHQMFTMDYG
jgi:hypothetical protein